MAKLAPPPITDEPELPIARPSARWIVALVAGDIVSFLVFAAVGRRSHNEASGPAAIGQIASTALPFALGWFLVSPWLGAFRRTLITSPRRMLARTELGWLAAWPVALLLRWALSEDHRVPISFAAVVLVSNAIFLGTWRGLFALAARKVRK
jgi:Protein of unknown function (DUF3054)